MDEGFHERRRNRSKKKVTKDDIIRSAIQDLRLTWEELMDITPVELYRLQLIENRKRERKWEIGREIIAACLNPHTKRNIKGKNIIQLSFDEEENRETIIDKDLAKKIKEKLN